MGYSLSMRETVRLTGDRAGTLTRLAKGNSDLCLVTMAGDKGILT
jgi:hypothetical protein